jgi:hypothetical protein
MMADPNLKHASDMPQHSPHLYLKAIHRGISIRRFQGLKSPLRIFSRPGVILTAIVGLVKLRREIFRRRMRIDALGWSIRRRRASTRDRVAVFNWKRKSIWGNSTPRSGNAAKSSPKHIERLGNYLRKFGCACDTVAKGVDQTMRKSLGALAIFLLILDLPAWAGLGSEKTMYVGGTVTSIKEGTEGKSSTNDEKVFVFDYKAGELKIPYEKVNDLEYGQKAGRRLGMALVISPFLLLSHKRKHFLTVGYTDENDKQQAAVFELGKNIVRITIASMEARTGKKVEYQDEESRKSGLGG